MKTRSKKINNALGTVVTVIAAVVIPSLSAFAQEWPQGEIKPVDIEIVDVREITLPPADRNFEKIPPRPSEPIRPPIRYDFQAFNFSAPAITPQIRPLKLKAASKPQVYGGYLRAGYGNFSSPLVEGYITSRRDRDKLVGAHFYHQSSAKGPVDGKNSGNGNTKASVFGRSFNENIVLSGRIDADNRTTHFYGYPEGLEVNKADIKQAYNLFKVSGDIANARNTDFSYTLGAAFSYLSDKYDAREAEADIIFNSGYKVSDDSRFNIDASYAVMSRKDVAVSSTARSLFIVRPTYAFSPVEDLTVRLGLAVAYENDTLDSKDLHIYPVVHASYPVSPSVDLFASLEGAMEKVTLQTLSYKNIWIAPNVPLSHANKFYELHIGMNAKLGNKVGVKGGFSNSSFRNMHFFVNGVNTIEQPMNQARFDVVYSDGVFYQTNVYGALSYAQSEAVRLMVRGDVFSYGTGNKASVREAWHMPRYKLNANASFNISQKLLLNLDAIGQGGMKALNPVTNSVVDLDGAMDLNAKVEYLFSPSFSIFLQFNNILDSNYPLYLYYPVRGRQFMGGFTWSF
jgi:hypothetical protein